MAETGESSYRRFLMGDKSALEEMIHTYSDALVRFAYCYVKSTDAAEEIMEDTFASLFIKAPRTIQEPQMKAYLFRIARNKAVDFLRRNKNLVPLEDVENLLFSGDLQEQLWVKQRNQKVYRCMQQLPVQYREMLELFYFEGFSTEEVCRIMGKNAKQVYNLHARAKTTLKQFLLQEGISDEDIF